MGRQYTQWESERGKGSIVFEIQQLVSGIEEIERSREDTEERMREYLKEPPYSRYMLSIEGIGEVTVSGAHRRGGRFYEVEGGCGDYEASGVGFI